MTSFTLLLLKLSSKPKPQNNHKKQEKERLLQMMLEKRPSKPQVRRKNEKQEEGEYVKREKKSGTLGNETLAYLREKAAKDHQVRMLQMKTQNEQARAQRLLLEQYHYQQQTLQQIQQQTYYSCRMNNRQ